MDSALSEFAVSVFGESELDEMFGSSEQAVEKERLAARRPEMNTCFTMMRLARIVVCRSLLRNVGQFQDLMQRGPSQSHTA
jgi:hypothetical protein